MKLFRVPALVLIVLMVVFTVVRAEEEAVPLETDSSETTDLFEDWYGEIELRTGMLWNWDREEWTGYASVPVLGYRAVTLEAGMEINPNEKYGPAGGILGLTYSLGNLRDWGVDVPMAQHVGVNIGPFLRYDFETGDTQTGAMVSLVDLSFSQGNVQRQRER